MTTQRILYVMNKPPVRLLPHFARCRSMFGICERYSLDRLHATYLRLGESTPESIRAAQAGLQTFWEEPFSIMLDWLSGNVLKPKKSQRGAAAFQRSLMAHMIRLGATVTPHSFSLHVSLNYDTPPQREIAAPGIGWIVDELLLVESVEGEGRHITHGRARLQTRQHCLAF